AAMNGVAAPPYGPACAELIWALALRFRLGPSVPGGAARVARVGLPADAGVPSLPGACPAEAGFTAAGQLLVLGPSVLTNVLGYLIGRWQAEEWYSERVPGQYVGMVYDADAEDHERLLLFPLAGGALWTRTVDGDECFLDLACQDVRFGPTECYPLPADGSAPPSRRGPGLCRFEPRLDARALRQAVLRGRRICEDGRRAGLAGREPTLLLGPDVRPVEVERFLEDSLPRPAWPLAAGAGGRAGVGAAARQRPPAACLASRAAGLAGPGWSACWASSGCSPSPSATSQSVARWTSTWVLAATAWQAFVAQNDEVVRAVRLLGLPAGAEELAEDSDAEDEDSFPLVAQARTWREAVAGSAQGPVADQLARAPPIALTISRSMLRVSGDPRAWLQDYLREKRLDPGSRVALEMQGICEALYFAGCYDSANLGSSRALEVMDRRLAGIMMEQAGPRRTHVELLEHHYAAAAGQTGGGAAPTTLKEEGGCDAEAPEGGSHGAGSNGNWRPPQTGGLAWAAKTVRLANDALCGLNLMAGCDDFVPGDAGPDVAPGDVQADAQQWARELADSR
ncbi:unnamed protein product, partial [Prorocentrum cordatum]